MYVIKRPGHRCCYLTRHGWTMMLQNASWWRDKESAEANLCPGNETVTTVENEMKELAR